MTEVLSFWLPIFLSSVAVFIVSSIIHMAPLWHKNDYPKMENEDKVMDALRSLSIPSGDYLVPRASNTAEMRSPEFTEKIKKGPVAMLTIWQNASLSMLPSLTLWFIYSIIVGLFAASIAAGALSIDADGSQIFRTIGLAVFMGYSIALWQLSIWYHRSWITAIKETVDGIIYAFLTAGIFVWLWPQ
jgi:hypothetical protein